MKTQPLPEVRNDSGAAHGSLAGYTVGFVLSIVLTLAAYAVVTYHLHVPTAAPLWIPVALILGLAVVQLVVQLVCFLHLGKESKPRWNLMVFMFMLMILVILVFGSLWIMNNLNYHSMSPTDMNNYIIRQEGIPQ